MPLQFDTDLPGGNGIMLNVDAKSRPPTVRFAVEARNCPEAMWFHFRLRGLANLPVRVILANPEQTLGGTDWSTNRLVWRPLGGTWRRSEPPTPLRMPSGRIEWAWQIPAAADGVEVAHCYPYQPADLERTLAEAKGTFSTAFIGVTQGNRPLVRVYNRMPDAAAPSVYVTARHHAGETPGSWVVDGLLRALAEDADLAVGVAFWIVPFVDLDDVVAGSYGKDPAPKDCNRGYGPGGPGRCECAAVMADANRLKAASNLRFFCDVHAPTHREQRIYVPLRGWDMDSLVSQHAREFVEAFAARVPENLASPVWHVTPPKEVSRQTGHTAARWARAELKTDAACLEVSYQGNGQRAFGIDDYRRLGRALAETLADWALERL